MKLWKLGATALTIGASLSLALLAGCGGSTTSGGGHVATPDTGKPDKNKDTTTPTPAGKKVALKPGKAVIKGTVTFDGPEPDVAKMNADLAAHVNEKATADKPHCLSEKAPADDKGQQVWRINPTNKGLKNVVVFLIPESGTYFEFGPNDEAVKAAKDKSVDLKQPFCAFEPHVAVLFSDYKNDKDKLVKTGEFVTVFNNTDKAGGKAGGIPHNTKWGESGNVTIPPGDKKEIADLKPSRTPVTFSCGIHPWMNAYLWVLDNPYFAITNEKGEYEIKNAPVGNVRIVAWHEGVDKSYMNADESKGEKITLKEGDNKKDFTGVLHRN